jgi:tetratricopeptide (TPR) repeat protein
MRLLRTWGLGVGAAVALCVSATVAVGQAPPPPPVYPECTKKPTPADIEGAKGAHNAAAQFYERAEYEKAIRYWNDALAFDCTAVALLQNIANAYEKLGDRAATVATLETYLKRTGPNPTIEQKVKNLKQLMNPQPTPTATPTAAPTAAPTATPSASASAIPTAPPAPDGARPYGYTPWVAVGGGAALVVVGAILMPIGYGKISTAQQTCNLDNHGCPKGTPPDIIDGGNTGRAMAGAGWGLFSVGLAAAGGGLVWQLLFNKPQASASTQPASGPGQTPAKQAQQKSGMWVMPAIGAGAAGVQLGGSF